MNQMKVFNFRSVFILVTAIVLLIAMGTQTVQAQVTLDSNPYYKRQEAIFLNNVRLISEHDSRIEVEAYRSACNALAMIIRFRLSAIHIHNADELPLVTDAMIQVYLRYCVNPNY